MNKQIRQMSENEVGAHLKDLELLARKSYNELLKESRKFKFKVNYFSAQSLAHVHALLIGYAACDMAEHFKSATLANEIYTKLIELLEKMRAGNSH